MTDSVARRLAVFLSKASFQSLSQPAVAHAKLAIADTLGSALAGSDWHKDAVGERERAHSTERWTGAEVTCPP